MTAMHFAIARSLPNVVYDLIEHGADLNAQDRLFKASPLHQAVKFKNLEILCMLLCYGADVTSVDRNRMTPLMRAIDMGETEIAYVLLDFYDDFSQTSKDNCDALLLAATNQNPIAVDLVKAGANPLCISDCHCDTFVFSLVYDKADFFKLIWFTHYHDLLDIETPFLLQYLKLCNFKKDEWVECLYLILTCPSAIDFVEQYKCFIESHRNHCITPLFQYLYLKFYKLQVQVNDRMKIMCLCLSLGAIPDFAELATVYEFYRFNEELQILIHVGGSLNFTFNLVNVNELLIMHILGKEPTHANVREKLYSFLLTKELVRWNDERNIVNFFKYVFVPLEVKKILVSTSLKVEHVVNIWPVMDAIEKSPTFPSLLDLTRNAVRNLIRKPNDKPYQFFDKANSLMLPKLLKNVICFKEPVYRLLNNEVDFRNSSCSVFYGIYGQLRH
ncbi:hypothetical protein RN001_015548 [Aquatica leii]|uniref:Uncharacterized protein n=1 Tax=Aquatica leii TaxID=1421715 RepID=A0AAN7NZB1_9COLE|nr:hypothetical protein RN001_015548 [Aquatica leii]